jgi:hypothetical protein
MWRERVLLGAQDWSVKVSQVGGVKVSHDFLWIDKTRHHFKNGTNSKMEQSNKIGVGVPDASGRVERRRQHSLAVGAETGLRTGSRAISDPGRTIIGSGGPAAPDPPIVLAQLNRLGRKSE